MKHPRLLVLAAALAFGNIVYAAPLDASNPFAKPSKLAFQYPAFDKIKNAHYMPAFEAGMEENVKEIEAIANNPKPASFENTIVAMEKAGQLLSRVSTAFYNLQGANTNDEMDKIDAVMAPKLSEHNDRIYLNDKLFQRVKAVYEQRDKLKLDKESKNLLNRYHLDFVLAGANLSPENKAKLQALNAENASLQSAFSQTILKGRNAAALVVEKREELAGMSEAAINEAAAAAKAKGMDGKFLVAVVNTSGQPPLAVLTNRDTRAKLMAASLNRGISGGEFDTRETVLKLVKVRAEKAALFGMANYAAYSLQDQTAKNPEAVNKLLAELAKPAVNNARKEAAELSKLAGGLDIGAHDWAFYTDKLRAEKYSLDENQLKPYFEMNSVMEKGVFFAAGKLYGLKFKERKDLPVYDPDVRVFDVFNENGKQLAIFIADMYARGNKQGGAWMNSYVSQASLFHTIPVVANHLNIPKPPKGEPTLLTNDEVKTMFHEFGHALHGMFSDVKYPRFTGTSVPRDFVEYPSQVNEMWALWPEILKNYAKHYKTGAPMPQDLLDKVAAAKKFNQGFLTTEYLAASLLDQRWHQLTPSQIPTDVAAFEAEALKNAGVDFAPVPSRYRTGYFSHAFAGGYSAGYYAYLWSEKLDADTVEWFKENGGLSRKNGDWFRKTLLSRGGTEDAMQLFHNFRGRDPQIQPLLERRGLTGQ